MMRWFILPGAVWDMLIIRKPVGVMRVLSDRPGERLLRVFF